jgi:hypothetical protein
MHKIITILIALRDAFASLPAAKRKAAYKLALGVGVALVVKFGVDADTATQIIETGVVFVTTVLVPMLAHMNASDD